MFKFEAVLDTPLFFVFHISYDVINKIEAGFTSWLIEAGIFFVNYIIKIKRGKTGKIGVNTYPRGSY